MSVAKLTVGRSGAGGANAEYITRENAAEKISFFNLNLLEANDLSEARTNAIAYAHTREDSELAKNKNGRTHYRLLLSWDRKEESEKVAEEAEKFLDKNLPEARAIIAVHQDTDHSHVHIWIDARQRDEKKVHLSKKQFQTFDERWAEQFDDAYGTSYAPKYKAKKAETKEWKKKVVTNEKELFIVSGHMSFDVPPKPERVADKFDHKYWREKEIENFGVNIEKGENINKDEKIGLGTNQFNVKAGNISAERSKQTFTGTESEPLRSSAAEGRGNGFTVFTSRTDDLALPESRANSGEGQGNESDFDQDQNKYFSISSAHNVYTSRNGNIAEEITSQENFAHRVYISGLREASEHRSSSLEKLSQVFSGSENFRTNNVETFEIPPIEIIEPQLAPNNEAFVNDIMDMMKNNLEEQNREMSLRAWQIFEKSLNTAANFPPAPAQFDYADKFNEKQENEKDRINLESKSRLEANYEITSKADNEDRRRILNDAGDSMEKAAAKEKKLEKEKEIKLEIEREFSMSM